MPNPSVFIPGSYKKSDAFAKDIIEQYLANCVPPFEIIEREENYDIDIVAQKHNSVTKYYFEAEVKTGCPFTTVDTFRHDTVSFLGRKKKWKDLPFWYIIVCRETDYAVMAGSNKIYQEINKEILYIDTKYQDPLTNEIKEGRKGNDEFYRVDKHLCHFFKIR